MQSTFFDSQLSRLKKALGVREDQEAATTLGMTKAAFSARKTRGSFPEKELRALAQQRPELGIDVEYVLTGGTLSQRQRLNQDQAYQFTQAMDASPENKEHLLGLLDRAGVTMASSNASRARLYEDITEMLGACSDETAELVLKLVVKLYRAELTEKKVVANADVLPTLADHPLAGGLLPMSMSQSQGEFLAPDEKALLDNYRHAPEGVRSGVKTTLATFAPAGAKHDKAA